MCLSFLGTTGWLEQYDEMVRFAPQNGAFISVQTLVWASIYSLKSMNI
jgi:hypothetical protein